jgi:DNA-directed RNA polymerase subunit RPC12/RpoP
MKCEKCGKEHDGTFATGRFCSRSCANKRILTNEHKEHIKQSVLNSPLCKKVQEQNRKKYICIVCGKEYQIYNRRSKCKNCRRKVLHIKTDYIKLLDFSKRTVSKILKRAKINCSICGWNKASCDIHHIIHRKYGGSDEHTNLIIVCPNCHRTMHELKEKYITIEQLKLLSIDKTFVQWKEFYNTKF